MKEKEKMFFELMVKHTAKISSNEKCITYLDKEEKIIFTYYIESKTILFSYDVWELFGKETDNIFEMKFKITQNFFKKMLNIITDLDILEIGYDIINIKDGKIFKEVYIEDDKNCIIGDNTHQIPFYSKFVEDLKKTNYLELYDFYYDDENLEFIFSSKYKLDNDLKTKLLNGGIYRAEKNGSLIQAEKYRNKLNELK